MLIKRSIYRALGIPLLALIPSFPPAYAALASEQEAPPLTVLDVRFAPGQREAEFSLRNERTKSVIAWAVGVTVSYPGRPSTKEFLAVDAYQEAAGLIEEGRPYKRALIKPGAILSWNLHLSPRDGVQPETVDLRAVAAILEGNVLVGDPSYGRIIRQNRERDARAFGELLSILEGARATEHDPMAALRKAIDNLDAGVTPHVAKNLAQRNLKRALRSAQEGDADAARALTGLIETTRRQAAAATAAYMALPPMSDPGAGRTRQ